MSLTIAKWLDRRLSLSRWNASTLPLNLRVLPKYGLSASRMWFDVHLPYFESTFATQL